MILQTFRFIIRLFLFLVSTNGSLERVSTNKLQKAVDEQKY